MVSRIAPKLLGYIPCQVSFSLDPHMHEQICLNQALTRHSKFLHCPTGSGHALDIVLDEPRGARDPTMEFFHENLQPCSQSFGNLPAQISCFLDTHRVFYEFFTFQTLKIRNKLKPSRIAPKLLGWIPGHIHFIWDPPCTSQFCRIHALIP